MNRPTTARLAVACLVASALAIPRQARGDAAPKLPDRALVISPGLTLGGTSSLDVGTGFTLGGEVSALYWHKPTYAGLVVDGLYDWKREQGRTMLGAMLGLGPLGLDGGYLVEYGDATRHGATLRLFFSLGIMALYLRYGGLVDAPDFLEWGLLFKVPIQAWSVYRPRPWRRGAPPQSQRVRPVPQAR